MAEQLAGLGMASLPLLLVAVVVALVVEISALSFVDRPARLWPFIIAVSVICSDIILAGRVFIPDVLLVGPIALGSIGVIQARRSRVGAPVGTGVRSAEPLSVLWTVLCVYLIVEAMRGVFFWSDLFKLRWVFFWVMLLVSPIALRRLPIPTRDTFSRMLLMSSAVYLTLFVVLRIASDNTLTSGRSSIFVSSGFPAVIAITAALVTLRPGGRNRFLATSVAVGALIAATVSDSRAAFISIAVIGLVSRLDTQSVLRSMWIFAIVMSVVAWATLNFNYVQRIQENAEAWQTYRAGGRPIYGDVDRLYKLEVALRENGRSLGVRLFGDGLTASGRIGAVEIVSLFTAYLPRYSIQTELTQRENVALTGTGGWIVDTGMVGVALLLVRIVSVTRFVWRRGGEAAPYLVAIPLLLVVWTMATSVMYLWLFWFMLMPFGLLETWARTYSVPDVPGARDAGDVKLVPGRPVALTRAALR